VYKNEQQKRKARWPPMLEGRESVAENLLYLRVRWKKERGRKVARGRNSSYFLLCFLFSAS
jgi:hypothetical protein